MHTLPAILAVASSLLATGCMFLDPTSDISNTLGVGPSADVGIILPEGGFVGPDGVPSAGARVGDECSSSSPCRPGLVCTDGACTPTGDSDEGDACTTSDECAEGLACGIPTECYQENPLTDCGFAQCLPSAGATEGEACVDITACGSGLRCELSGFTGVCVPQGEADVGQPCAEHADCLAPLLCAPPGPQTISDEPTCQIPAAVARQLFLPSVTCEAVPQRSAENPDVGPDFAVYFELSENADAEFYRLPFPNDARLRGGRVDMTGHHNPGAAFIGGDLVESYLDAAEAMNGFSTNPAVFFRFTQAPDFGSIVGDGDNPTLHFVNIDTDSEGYGERVAMRWTITTGGGKFICPRYMVVRPSWSSPLRHGTTYSVYLTNGVRGGVSEAIPLVQPDFEAMLEVDEPGDARLQRGWRAYEPFRAYLDQEGIAGETIIAAAVFTTHDPDALIPKIRAAARDAETPTLDNVTLCGENVTSPCDDGAARACVNEAGAEYLEVHATYEAPVWQRGTRPYLTVDDGGALTFSDGVLASHGTETICVSLTIPRSEMPESGWPVSMFAHGTGGSFVSHISGGTAQRLASIDLGDEVPTRIASVGIEGAQHGSRRGGSDLSPEFLFYNFGNPTAAIGNVEQAAADYFLLTAMLEELTFEVDGVEFPVRFDPDRITFFGHSQGATLGGLFAPHEENLLAAVFSGAGGSLVLSLLHKTSPEDVASGVEFVLTDGGTTGGSVTDGDPLLAILQMVFDRVDPLNYARLIYRSTPSEGGDGLHVFQSYGFGDTYTPEPNQQSYSRAAGLQIPTPLASQLDGYGDTPYPISGNRAASGEPVTAVVIPATPDGYDGHFVIFRDEALSSQASEFLGTAARDGIPTVSDR